MGRTRTLLLLVWVAIALAAIVFGWTKLGDTGIALTVALTGTASSVIALYLTSSPEEPELQIVGNPYVESDRIRVTISNNGPGTAKNCYGKVTLSEPRESLLRFDEFLLPLNETHGFPAYLYRDAPGSIRGSSVAWAEFPNPPRLTLDEQDYGVLMLGRRLDIGSGRLVFEVPSEEGEGRRPVFDKNGAVVEPARKARAYLMTSEFPYSMLLRVGSESTSGFVVANFQITVPPVTGSKVTAKRTEHLWD